AEALLTLLGAPPRAMHRAAETGDEQRRQEISGDLDQLLCAAQADAEARLDEQQLGPEPPQRRREDRRTRTAVPRGDDDRAEHRDERHALAEPWGERLAQGERDADGEDRDEIGSPGPAQGSFIALLPCRLHPDFRGDRHQRRKILCALPPRTASRVAGGSASTRARQPFMSPMLCG